MFKCFDMFDKTVVVLTIDWDYWYLSSAVVDDEEAHCGDCKLKEHGVIGRSDLFVRSSPNISKLRVLNLLRNNNKSIPLFVTDNHRDIVRIFFDRKMNNVDKFEIYNIDSHVDDGSYNIYFELSKVFNCGNWVNYLKNKLDKDIDYNHIYLKNKIWNQLLNSSIDVVHICRSSPFSVPDGDGELVKFVCELESILNRKSFVYGRGSKDIQRSIVDYRKLSNG